MSENAPENEVALSGGSTAPVVRIGSTVRRKAGPWTPSIHALLHHIKGKTSLSTPEPFGIDARGREILSFLDGDTAQYPLPEWMWSDETLSEIAKSLRSYHDSTVQFTAPLHALWQWPAHEPHEVICHNDFAPYNLLFKEQQVTGIIDFDMASPGPRIWDIAYTTYRFVPLTARENPDTPEFSDSEQLRRLALFCSAYNRNIAPSSVLVTATQRLDELMDFIIAEAKAGNTAQQHVLARGDVEIYKADRAHIHSLLS